MLGALGFFVHEADTLDSLLGYEAGHTYIPQWVLLHGHWQQRGSLRDVVRHEYGHAIAHYYPTLIQRSSRFSTTFGGRYFGQRRTRTSSRDFVSGYAKTCPAEDFSETFMLFLRHSGRLPTRFAPSAINCKWQFIEDLAAIVESGGTKW